MKSICNRLNFVAISLVAAVVGGTASAADLLVPSQYNTIQSAIDAAVSGDHVLVSEGTYLGQVNLSGKNIQLIGVSGATSTFIDGENAHTVMIGNGEPSTCLVQGFTIQHGRDGGYYSGAGVRLTSSNVVFDNCRFIDNRTTGPAWWGAGAWRSENGNPSITNCLFERNSGDYMASCIYHYRGGGIVVSNCIFTDNSSKNGECIHIQNEGEQDVSSIQRCVFRRYESRTSGWGSQAVNIGGRGANTCSISECSVEDPIYPAEDTDLTIAFVAFSSPAGQVSLTNIKCCGGVKNLLSRIEGGIYIWTDGGGNSVSPTCTDCNGDGITDYGQILLGELSDSNNNGVPDVCEQVITSVKPVSGASTGGTAVRINGNNFPSSPTVAFGGVSATDIVVLSPTLITAVTPAGTPGMTMVTVNSASSESFYYRPSCDGDLDNNGTIDSSDLGLLLINMGDCSSSLTTPQEQEPLIFQSAEPAKALKK